VKTNFTFQVGTKQVRTVRKAGLLSLHVFFLCQCRVRGSSAKGRDEQFWAARRGSIFQHVFGKGFAAQILLVMVALSCFGNIVRDLLA
jgi:hypothetical protein